MKKITVVIALLCSIILFAGCTQQPQDSGPDYADNEVMAAIADGLESRFDVVDKHEQTGDAQTKDGYAEAIQVEIDAIAPFRDRQFEDSKLQETVLSYANLLDDSLELLDQYPVDSIEFYDAWNAIYDERTVALKLFVETYGLEIDPAHEETLNDLLLNANTVEEKTEVEDAINQLVASLAFEKVDEGYGMATYTAVAENTTEIGFEDVGITLALYDKDGVKIEETYAGTSSWPVGEKVRFEAFGASDASEVKTSVSYYSVVE